MCAFSRTWSAAHLLHLPVLTRSRFPAAICLFPFTEFPSPTPAPCARQISSQAQWKRAVRP